jgi:hypothetical protein
VWTLAFGVVVFLKVEEAKRMALNEWGDFLGGLSAPIALLWLVIGYFQQGEELQLNTAALRAQQEELRRQVEETSFLAKNADRQATAAEILASLNKTDREKLELKERSGAQPVFWSTGGSVSGSTIRTRIVNRRGGEVTDVSVIYKGPYNLSLSVGRLWKSDETAELVLVQPPGTSLAYPIRFGFRYTDRFNERHEKQLELMSPGEVQEVREESGATAAGDNA